MCGGSFFAEWPLCQNCLFVHGLRSERDVKRYVEVLSSASSELCGAATPTAIFRDIFSTLDYAVAAPTDGATVSSDRAVSKTDISYYMTTTISQGPGKITGSALSATATEETLSPQTTNAGNEEDDDGETATSRRGSATNTASSAVSGTSGAAAAETSKDSSAAGVKAGVAGFVGVAALAAAMML